MHHHSKLQIYKGIIQYLLDSTNYTIKNIAEVTNSSVKNIRAIYYEDKIPAHFSEINLVKLYHMILELNPNGSNDLRN
jgi:hypothetical protein